MYVSKIQIKATLEIDIWRLLDKCVSKEHVEKAMAPHSSTLTWKIPWTEEPGRLQSMGSLGVTQD